MVTVVGEAVVDLLPTGPRVGGSPLNVAVGLVRLGVEVTLVTALGDDPYGDLVRAHLREAGVGVIAAPIPRTPTATVTFTGPDAHYDLDLAWDLDGIDLPTTEHLHVGSLGAAVEPGATTVRTWAAQAGSVSYDPNLRPGWMPAAAAVLEVAAYAATIKLSEDDARLLAPEEDPAVTARDLLGPVTSLVVLTRGARGATAFTTAGELDVAAVPVEVVDTIGAGDAFMAGLLAARALPLERQLGAAAASAALSCSRSGA